MLELKNISKMYPGFSLDKVSLQVEKGSYFVLLGPSGAGKTQLLEIILGLVRPDGGEVFVEGKPIGHLPVRKRPVGIVFQDLAIFPHMNVKRNISYELRDKNFPSQEIKKLVHEEAEKLGITHLLKRKPSTLSGGELQRVALARTLIRKPGYLLLDEPLSSLDVQLRQDLFGILRNLHRSGQTILHVTHDYEEALVLATHTGVMHNGKIIQSGTADKVFHNPGSEFVARFTGIKNYFPATLKTSSGMQMAELSNGLAFRLVTEVTEGKGFVLIPGEEIIISRNSLDSSATNQLAGTIREIFTIPGGSEVLIDAKMPLYVRVTRESVGKLQLEPGQEVYLSFKASSVRFIRA